MAKGLLLTLTTKAVDIAHLQARRVVRKLSTSSPAPGFFDQYPRFYSTSVTNSTQNRLNQRYRACIGSCEAIIRGKRVLDIASHDGRWSFAAYAAGARHVLGIEAREHLVTAANANMREYQVPADRFRFILGDVFAELDRLEANSVDTVFCFGFLYHTIEHMVLLRMIERLKPKHVILDTTITRNRDALIRLVVEEVDEEADAVAIPGLRKVISGTPS